MSEVVTSEFGSDTGSVPGVRVAKLMGTIVFGGSLCLLVITAIPYGTVEVWWRAFFVCVVLALAILWLVEAAITDSWITQGGAVLLPIAALICFSFLQTVSLGNSAERPAGISLAPWSTISVDPYQTRFFALQLLALALAALLLFRYVSTERRLRILVNVILAVVVATALFGILRQTTQRGMGFGLPLLQVNNGYGQFINKNHFAYLMEMGFGLALGLIVGRGVKREHLLFYVAALLPIWVALVLCGSRGGVIAMMTQVVMVVGWALFRQRREPSESNAGIEGLRRSWVVRTLLALVLVAGVAVGTLWMGGEPLATRIEGSANQLTAGTNESREGTSRNEIWQLTLKMFAAHPVFGVGLGSYWVAVPAFHDGSGKKTPQQAHNDYLELLASGGVVGLLIGVWFVVVVVRRLRRNLRSPHRFHRAACLGAVIAMSGVAVHSLMDFGLHMIVNAFVFTTLLVIATSKPGWANRSAKEIG